MKEREKLLTRKIIRFQVIRRRHSLDANHRGEDLVGSRCAVAARKDDMDRFGELLSHPRESLRNLASRF